MNHRASTKRFPVSSLPAMPDEQRPQTSLLPDLTRRRMLQLTGLNLLGFAAGYGPWVRSTRAAETPAVVSLPPLNRFPRMVQEYFVARVRQMEQASLKAQAALQTKADAEAHVQLVREKIRACFGPFPEKTPLKPRVTGTVERDAYTIEKIIFESRPGLLVTGNLYLPKGRPLPLPGVVGVCGHSDNGKANEAYQSFSQGLARMGYVVLIIDPLGQGERLQYPDANLKSRIGVGVREHLYGGNQQFLVGEFFGAWSAWDGIRALDYLLTRPEVDPRHVGVTGNSGGGTLTTWLCGLDARWTMAAPSCFVTTFRHNLENELPADTEQCPPRALALGLDHEDFIAALAPKPVILLSKERDFFDVRGTEAAFARLKRLYKLLGAPENIALFTGPTTHGYSQENREAMYRWFNRVTGVSDAQTEPKLVIEKDETLWCAPRGQVVELQSRSLHAFTREHSQSLAGRRPKLQGAALAQTVAQMLKLPQRSGVPDFRILRPAPSRKYPRPYATTYAVQTEPGIHALVYRLGGERHDARPPKGPARAVLYVAHRSSDAELREEPLIRELLNAEPDAAFYACDVRGIGESQPDTCGQNTFLNPYGSDYFYAIHSLMLDAPYVGQKTHDVLAVLDWLKSHRHEEVHLVGKAWGALPATFAALISDLVTQVTLEHALTSYAAIAESENYQWPLAAFVPGVLAKFDLPDCYRELAAKKLRHIEPWDAGGSGG
jgi:dienelactone hydrolase